MTVTLDRGATTHWSTAMYGTQPTGHIFVFALTGPPATAEPTPTPLHSTMLSIGTGAKTPDTHGGNRRIDIYLTDAQRDQLIAELQGQIK